VGVISAPSSEVGVLIGRNERKRLAQIAGQGIVLFSRGLLSPSNCQLPFLVVLWRRDRGERALWRGRGLVQTGRLTGRHSVVSTSEVDVTCNQQGRLTESPPASFLSSAAIQPFLLIHPQPSRSRSNSPFIIVPPSPLVRCRANLYHSFESQMQQYFDYSVPPRANPPYSLVVES
jgi:hypothetical protein